MGMRKDQVEKKISEIEKRVTSSKLSEACIDIMKRHGTYQAKDSDEYVAIDASYEDDLIKITYKGEREGELRVTMRGAIVFSALDGMTSERHPITALRYPKVGNHYIREYHSGVWEDYIERLWITTKEELKREKEAETEARKRLQESEEEVSGEVLSILKNSFPGFF